jgi:hypothetical protein
MVLTDKKAAARKTLKLKEDKGRLTADTIAA